MTSLHPYQRELLAVLQDPASPRFGVISAVVGTGVRQAIEMHIREIASKSLVLVLCSRRLIVDHWAERLLAYEDVPVLRLTSADAALYLLDRQPQRRTGVLLATYARTQHGPSSRVLSELNFGLIVHDQPPSSLSVGLERLNSRAQRAIAIVDRGKLDSPVAQWQWPLLWSVSIEKLVRDCYFAPIGVPYEPTPEERALRAEAIRVLQDHATRQNAPLFLASDSLPELHRRLLSLASDTPRQEDEDLTEQAWMLLDRMEGSLSDDSRLQALDEILRQTTIEGARCIVLAATRTDVEYIADYLGSTGKPLHAALTAATKISDRRSALAGLRPGECLVATHVVAESWDGWPADAAVILWPSPANRRLPQDLFLSAARTNGVKVFELSERIDSRQSHVWPQ